MGEFLTTKQRTELQLAHRAESSRRFADRIKTILLLDAGWPAEKIAEALLIDADTVRRYRALYESGGLEFLCSFAYEGRRCFLSSAESKMLVQELRSKIYLCTSEVVSFIKQRFGVSYSTAGVTALLHRLGFSYKKPSLVPGKADAAQQQQFMELLLKLKRRKNPADKLYYGDGMHPQHNSLPSYGWLPRGEEVALKSNTGRQRVNISGVLDADTHEVLIQEHQRLNAETTVEFFRLIERQNPKSKTIYLILDNAGYYKGEKIQEYLQNSKIRIIFLPPYAPNLNLIERLWKFFKKLVLYNRYYPTFQEFRTACLEFFERKNLQRHRKQLRSLLTENFQLVSA
jgi:transposase